MVRTINFVASTADNSSLVAKNIACDMRLSRAARANAFDSIADSSTQSSERMILCLDGQHRNFCGQPLEQLLRISRNHNIVGVALERHYKISVCIALGRSSVGMESNQTIRTSAEI
jgi:hypothetical protein